MVISSRRLLEKSDGWWQFMELRLIRITPMYWLVTVAKLVAITAVPAMALHTHPTEWNTISAFLFIPARDAVGVIRPPLDVGWTLSFEMLFYLVFASALFLRIAPLRIIAPVMVMLAVLALTRSNNGPAITMLANPIVLEFVFGAAIGKMYIERSLSLFSSPWIIMLSVAGLFVLVFIPANGNWHRAFIWGFAAAAALTGGVLAEKWLDPLLPRFLERIGEASYSLYLTHGFVLPVVGLVIARTGLTGDMLGAALIITCVIISTISALIIYRFVEVPITTWLRKLVGDRRRASLAAPQTAI